MDETENRAFAEAGGLSDSADDATAMERDGY